MSRAGHGQSEIGEVEVKEPIARNRKEDIMETLAGDKLAWGEEWGYGRDWRHYYRDVTDIVPSSREGADDRNEYTDPGDLAAPLFCTVFSLLLIVSGALWWIAR